MTDGMNVEFPAGGDAGQGVEDRVLDAALECIGRWGMTKTTAEDIARTAALSRATLYRAFPGGIATILDAMSARQVERLLAEVVAVTATAGSVEEILTSAIVAAGRFLDEASALHYLMAHEPEVLLPYFAFDRIGPLLSASSAALAPILGAYVSRQVAEELVEWGGAHRVVGVLHPRVDRPHRCGRGGRARQHDAAARLRPRTRRHLIVPSTQPCRTVPTRTDRPSTEPASTDHPVPTQPAKDQP
ncbi:MAG: TetR/AcrR family transcriptional regulator [Microthrixaceae bacterium]|nr:TetR/AcrR family transcriptional regulator [Microthrixaceae bacterium]